MLILDDRGLLGIVHQLYFIKFSSFPLPHKHWGEGCEEDIEFRTGLFQNFSPSAHYPVLYLCVRSHLLLDEMTVVREKLITNGFWRICNVIKIILWLCSFGFPIGSQSINLQVLGNLTIIVNGFISWSGFYFQWELWVLPTTLSHYWNSLTCR